jgi:hypothetical protein
VFDGGEGVKKGLKITFNNLNNIPTYKPVKVYLSVFLENKRMFDEFGNPGRYNTNMVDDHCPKDVTLMPKKPPRIQVDLDEVLYFVKHVEGLIAFFKKTKHVYIVIEVNEVEGDYTLKSKTARPLSYILQEKKRLVGYKMFRVTDYDYSLKQGRFKELLTNPPVREPPPNPQHELKFGTVTLDFTIEVFEYTTATMGNFAYRRRKKPEERKKKVVDLIDRRPFIPNDTIQYNDEPFLKGSGIDIYVDGARYLPNSVTMSKIMVRVMDN